MNRYLKVPYAVVLNIGLEDVCKMFGHPSRVSSWHQNQGYNSYEHISGNEWFSDLIERSNSTINT